MWANLYWLTFGEGRVVSLLSWKCRNNFLPPNLHQIPQLHYWIYFLHFARQHPHPKFWTSITDVLHCLFPKAVEMNQLQYLSLDRGRFLAQEERIFPLGTGKEMEKYLGDGLIASTSLVTTCQTAQVACDHLSESTKEGQRCKAELGGYERYFGFWGWGFLRVRFLRAQVTSDVLLSDSCWTIKWCDHPY